MNTRQNKEKRTPKQTTRMQGNSLGTPKGVVKKRSVNTAIVPDTDAKSGAMQKEAQPSTSTKCANPDCRIDSAPPHKCQACDNRLHHICCISVRLDIHRTIRGEEVRLDYTDVLACSRDCYNTLQCARGSKLPPLGEEDDGDEEEEDEEEIQRVRKRNKKNNQSSLSGKEGKKVSKSTASQEASIQDGDEDIKVISPTEIEVTTRRRHITSIKCPCRNNCGKLVNVGTYGANGGGENGCPHCPANPGRHWKIPADFVTHVQTTKRCLKKQGIEPDFMTPIQTLGPFLSWLANDMEYQLLREEGAKDGSSKMCKLFTCPSCNTCMSYAHRHAHLVNKHDLHIGLVDHVAHRGLNLGVFMDMIAAERSSTEQNDGST